MSDYILYDGSYLLHFGVGWVIGKLNLPQWFVWILASGKEIFDLLSGNKIDITDFLITILGFYLAKK